MQKFQKDEIYKLDNLDNIEVIHDIDKGKLLVYQPKAIAEITLCGCITLTITKKDKSFIKPTPEQIKNLHDMLCIDVKLFNDAEEIEKIAEEISGQCKE